MSQVRLTSATFCNEAARSAEDRGPCHSLVRTRETSSEGIHGEWDVSMDEVVGRVNADVFVVALWRVRMEVMEELRTYGVFYTCILITPL